MAAHRGLNEVLAFLQDLTREEARAARAALAEPDDDRYLELRAGFTDRCGEGLFPVVDRFAVPGGHSDDASPERGGDIRPRILFEVVAGTARGRATWHAYLGDLRSEAGVSIDQEWTVTDDGGRLRLVGRRATNPFSDELEWENADGTPLEFDHVDETWVERLPLDPAHARFLQQLAGE